MWGSRESGFPIRTRGHGPLEGHCTWGGLSGKERTALKRQTSHANGMKCGRPRKFDDADAAKARQLRAKGIAATDIAKMLSVSRATGRRTPDDGWAAWLGLGIVTVGTKGVLAPVLRRQLSGMSWSPLES